MNRLSFKLALENRLRDVYEEDKKDALEYYDELFDDMGLTNDDEIPEEFNNIEKIVQDIKRDSRINRVFEKSKKENNLWKNIVIIILAILASPIAVPLAIAAIIILFVPIIVLGSIFFAFIISIIASIYAIIVSVISFGTFPLGIFGILLIMIGLTIITFIFIKFLIIKIKDFTVRKLKEKKQRKEGI
ncbi:DUF1700 domain-containing protein [Peptostreptococcaceae bacterium OttesenSCG-928-C18]|nr:DUF1700 domain-containing protein [Peptostreptococcaceae bacterium OttesenSCG-928-C18]